MSNLEDATAPLPALDRTAGPRLRMIAAAAVAASFLPTWSSLVRVWWDFAVHGFAAAGLAAWLIWRDQRSLLATGRGSPVALALVVGASLIWLAGFVLHAQVVHQAALPLLLLLWLLAVAGPSVAATAAPIAGVFLIAVPLWDVLTRPLQTLTVLANALLLRLARIDATIDGDLIRIPEGTFWVAEGCAGIDYFQIGLLVGLAHAMLFLRTWRARFAAVATAVASVIIMNWLRVFGLVVIGHVTAMQSPLVRDHGTYGWILFAVALAIFLVIAGRIERREAQRAAASPDATGGSPAPGAPWSTGAARDHTPRDPAQRNAGAVPTRRLAAATFAAISGPLLHLALTAGPAPSDDRLEALARLSPPDGWSLEPADSAVFAPAFSGADFIAQTHWQRGDARVQVDRLLYGEQRQGKELIGYPNVITPDSLRIAEGRTRPLGPAGLEAEVAIVRTASGPRLVWWWYRVAGEITASPSRAKLLELRAFVRRDRVAELIAVSTACRSPGCREAGAVLAAFLDDAPALMR